MIRKSVMFTNVNVDIAFARRSLVFSQFKNKNKMAVAYRTAVVLLIEELSDDLILQETRSCEDEEFLLLLLITERHSHVRIENYFKR